MRKGCPTLLGGLPLRVKVQTSGDMDIMKVSPFWTGCSYRAGVGAGSSGLGFHMGGTVPNAKKCMGTPNPRCFPAGTWILPTLKFLSRLMRLRSLGGMRHKGASTSTIKLESAYRGIQRKKSTDYRLSCRVHTEAYRERNLQITG